MLFTPQAATKPLTEFLRHLAISLEAGIDIRKTLANEARRSPPGLRSHIEWMSELVNSGSTLTVALQGTGDYFPTLVRELVSVGEQTGHLPEVLKQLVEHYEEQLALRRMFLSTIAWPMAQLGIALGVVGFLIWVSAVITRITNNPTDILGLGLTGEGGLLVYLAFLGAVIFGIYIIYRAIVGGQIWVAPVQRVIMRLPVLGQALRTLSLARFAWTLQMTLGAALDVKRALSMALANTHNIEFTEQDSRIGQAIQRGDAIHEALTEAGVFPIEFIHAVEVGENSGRLVETLAIVARQQVEEARRALSMLTKLSGWGVWCVVAGMIILLIFRVFGAYLGTINRALNGFK